MTNDQPGDSRASVLFTNNQCGDHQKPVAGREVLRLEVIRMVWKPEDTERRNGHDHKGGSDGCDNGDHVSIPDICHERQEYIRVNFFWPV